jgi:coenzyme F420 hydrogenase subunit beta
LQQPLSVQAIVDAGLCVGCGLCKSIAGDERIRIEMSADGIEVPQASGPIDDQTLRLINAVCPGLRAEGPTREAASPQARWDTIWGPAVAMAKGHAGDADVRFQASAGGGLSALAIHLLDSGEVDFILHVAASQRRPMRTEAHLSFDRGQVLEGAGSRYGPAATLIDLVGLLDRGRPFAVVAKPCDLSAIANLARHDPRVNELIRYRLCLVCGGASAFTKTLDLIEGFGLSEDEVSLLRYRGYGNPGRTRVETQDGRAFEVTYNDLWAEEGKWRLFFRCKICADPIGEVADIAVSDVWPGGGPTGEDAGFNGFIARTERGATLLRSAAAAGALTLTEELDFRDFDRFQPHQVRKKQAIAARLAAMRDAGLTAPEYPDLRLDEAAATASESFREENYRGMLSRLKARNPTAPE